MEILRPHGIYTLPDGKSYAAIKDSGGDFFLYPSASGPSHPPTYEVTAEGAVKPWLSSGREWTVKDLTDTGETYGVAKGVFRNASA